MANYTVTVTRKYSYKKQANRTLQQRRDDEDVLLFNNNNGNKVSNHYQVNNASEYEI